MTGAWRVATALLLLAGAAAVRTDPPGNASGTGQRIGGEAQDQRVARRIDTRQSKRVDMRLQPRTIGRSLTAAISPVTTAADGGCARDLGQPPEQPCRAPQ